VENILTLLIVRLRVAIGMGKDYTWILGNVWTLLTIVIALFVEIHSCSLDCTDFEGGWAPSHWQSMIDCELHHWKETTDHWFHY
jgi:hypothetical protein